MAGLRRRTAFAAPLVVIVACGSDGDRSAHRGQSWTVRRDGATCRAEVVIDCPRNVACNPPAPRVIPCPEGATQTANVTVAEIEKGRCAIVPRGCSELACATAETPCPDASSVAPPVSRPDAPTLGVEARWTITRDAKACLARITMGCPGVRSRVCNPPPPSMGGPTSTRTIECPSALGDKPALEIAQFTDGTCAETSLDCFDKACARDPAPCL